MSADLNWDDRADFEYAQRGLIDKLEPCVIRDATGRVVWDNERWDFLASDECPSTVNPSLWRQGQLNRIQGLFEICPSVYQLRGQDCDNITIIEGDGGIVLVDPMLCVEVAAEAMQLYRRNRGERPVKAVVYTHSHGDHFGGVLSVTSVEDVASGNCQIIAPEHFMDHAVSENLIAGPAMRQRGTFQYGSLLTAGPEGAMGGGLAQAWSSGVVTLIPPTIDITETGQELTIAGVRMIFQLTPETEAPAEMNLYFPEHKVLLGAENINHTLHNVLTLRGALIRDAQRWAGYITEAIQLFAADADILIGSHHWPVFGNAELTKMLFEQRDAYSYIHDQTVRLMNRGLTGTEIAEELTEFPAELGRAWNVRGYYGSISHNVKAVYQRYMGWYDGNPAHLWQLPPTEVGERYVRAFGGADAVVAIAREAFEQGDHRFVAELLNHVIFSQPGHAEARELQARNFEQLAYPQENGTWRNAFLTAADELRGVGRFAPGGVAGSRATLMSPSMLAAVTVEQTFRLMAVRLDGPRAAAHRFVLRWDVGDPAETWTTVLANGVFSPVRGEAVAVSAPDVTIKLGREALSLVMSGASSVAKLVADGTASLDGDQSVVETFEGLLEQPASTFALATP